MNVTPPELRRTNAVHLSIVLLATIAALAASGCTEDPPGAPGPGGGEVPDLDGGLDADVGPGCTSAENADGTRTIACPDATALTYPAGLDCAVAEADDGSATATCGEDDAYSLEEGCASRLFDFRTHRVLATDCPDGSAPGLVVRWSSTPDAHIALSHDHVCALRADGSASCWGTCGSGECDVPADTVLVQVAAGSEHTCGLDAYGNSHCVGNDGSGRTEAQYGEPFIQIVAGGDHTCGLRESGVAHCWGDGTEGQTAEQDGVFVQLTAGGKHTCGLRPDGSAHCWGRASEGQTAPQPDERFVQLEAGGLHTCGLRADGSAHCWGSETFGKTDVNPSHRFVQITAGSAHTCGLRPDGSSLCWGENAPQIASQPGETFVELAAGSYATCGLRADGTTHCWGDTSGADSTLAAIDPGFRFRCREADAPAGLEPGLAYERWDFVTTGLPNFDSMGPAGSTGTLETVGVPSEGDGFALRLTGYVHVPARGQTLFALASDDGSRLRIGADVVIDNDGEHLATTQTEFLCLEAGWHAITVEYFENSGPETLSLAMAPYGEAPTPIAPAELAHVP